MNTNTPHPFDLEVMRMAMELVKLERIRKVQQRNCSMSRDDSCAGEQLADAAATYLLAPAFNGDTNQRVIPACWPWDSDKFKPGVVELAPDASETAYREHRIGEVIKGLALGIAELERLMRADLKANRSDLILPESVNEPRIILPGRLQ